MTFIGAFVVAFVKGWLLTLVMLSSIPALIISGAVMSITIGKLSSRGQSAYSLAAVVAEQTIGSIRTVRVIGTKSPKLILFPTLNNTRGLKYYYFRNK